MEDNENDLKDKTFKILIVDDEKEVRDSLSMTLELAKDFNSDITSVNNADDALAKMINEEFDLILADHKMPGMSGVDLLSKVKEEYPKTSRILITGYSDIETAKKAINNAKVDNYLEKPWNNQDLRSTILQALTRRKDRELWDLTEVDNVKEALKIIAEAKESLLDKIPPRGAKQILILEFKSAAEFNKFSFEIRQMKNISIDDMEIFEKKYIVKLGIYMDSFEKIV